MSKRLRERAAAAVRQLPADIILQAAAICSGHNILVEVGIPQVVIDLLNVTHRSDGTNKGSIFVHGRMVREAEGVSGLSMLMYLAAVLDIDYPHRYGRGSQAHAIRRALREHLQSGPDNDTVPTVDKASA